MLNSLKKSVRLAAVTAGLVVLGSGLTGCVLAPQTIALNDNVALTPATPMVARDALVRVVDEREQAPDVIGHRGGRLPENSPLLSERPISDALSDRLQNSLKTLGFGSSSPVDPLKVQLAIQQFSFECNEGVIVNECSVRMAFALTILDGAKTFTKPFKTFETRSLAASPVAEYNQTWVNEVLDKVWTHMFSDAEVLNALQVSQ
ncbi:YajG family lipoprotein [Thalassolituus sp. LLYu03]|uniref:YajG family lipoprotein n=1 Tax=Thalassolituus sp. LLYu03 TaxID=3421656 RepID=UPI003D2931F7